MNQRHIISGILTVLVIGILIAAGPASAFNLGLLVAEEEITFGDIQQVSVSFTADTGDAFVPLEEFQLAISNGENTQICHFNTDGNIISGCEGLTITPDSENQFSYGYGYGYGYYGEDSYAFGYGYGANLAAGKTVTYTVTMDTSNLEIGGTYDVTLLALINDVVFSSDTGTFEVVAPVLIGDLNGDGVVGSEDLNTLLELWGPVLDGSSASADLNTDGVIDGADLGILLGNWSGSLEPLFGDLDNDGFVNESDVAMLTLVWGSSGQDTGADLNADGTVDGADLGLLLGAWYEG